MICHKSRSNKKSALFVCFWTDLGLGCILLSIRDLAPFLQFGVLPNLQYGHNILHWGDPAQLFISFSETTCNFLTTSSNYGKLTSQCLHLCHDRLIRLWKYDSVHNGCFCSQFFWNMSFEKNMLKRRQIVHQLWKEIKCGLKSLIEWTNPSPPPLLPLLPCNKAINRG